MTARAPASIERPQTERDAIASFVSAIDRHDIMTLSGLASLAYGLQLLNIALAFVVIGAILFSSGLLLHILRPIREKRPRVRTHTRGRES